METIVETIRLQGGHMRWICSRRTKFREVWDKLDEKRKEERLEIWNSNLPISDLIPGLLDPIVEFHIWPCVRKFTEDVQGTDGPQFNLKAKMMCIQSLFQTSRKWRHLVTASRAWGGMRLCRESFTSYAWWQETVHSYFRHYCRVIPPVEAFSRMELSNLVEQVDCWKQYEMDEINEFLKEYSDPYDPYDHVGRALAWKEQRFVDVMTYNWLTS